MMQCNAIYDSTCIFPMLHHRAMIESSMQYTVEKILPISLPEKEEDKNRNYFYYEPSKLCISESLIESFLKIKIYNFLLESAISEHSARMIAMGKATDNAKELLKDLKLIFNRTRQSAITKEILIH